MTWTKQPKLVTRVNAFSQLLITVLRIQALDKLAKAQRLLATQAKAKGNADAMAELEPEPTFDSNVDRESTGDGT